jgi:hypothetical protein
VQTRVADEIDKATTDRNAKILRELVKQPDNKNCADCRKNGMSVLRVSGRMLISRRKMGSMESVRQLLNV